ncbi:MAG: cupin domain-containing protein [Chitinophagaceae bacterium]|nr:MAG: cupin domain-containing protein [Chitinophagaceae bacterium]
MNTMTTVSEVLNNLKKEGYTEDFNLGVNCLVCDGNRLEIRPEEFVVDRHYRFEGPSDPGDEAIVYAISSEKHNLKGTLVDGYGIYSENESNEIVKALREKTNSAYNQNQENETEVRANDSTPQRPEGARTIEAPLVEMDLNEFIRQIKEEKPWQIGDRNSITIYKSDTMRIVLIGLHAGAEMKTHTAPGIISVHCLEGQINFTAEGKNAELTAGKMIALKTGIPHSVRAVKESVFLLTMAVVK